MRVCFRMSDDLVKVLDEQARRERRSRSSQVVYLLERALRESRSRPAQPQPPATANP